MQRTTILALAALFGSTALAFALTPAPQRAPAGILLVQDTMKHDTMSKDDKMKKDEKMSKDSMKKDEKMSKDTMKKQ